MKMGKKSRQNFIATAGTVRFPSTLFSTQVEEAPLETFLNGTSTLYAEQMYEMYLEDPASVQESWRQYFENEENAVPFDVSDYNKPTSVPGKRSVAVAGVRTFIRRFIILEVVYVWVFFFTTYGIW